MSKKSKSIVKVTETPMTNQTNESTQAEQTSTEGTATEQNTVIDTGTASTEQTQENKAPDALGDEQSTTPATSVDGEPSPAVVLETTVAPVVVAEPAPVPVIEQVQEAAPAVDHSAFEKKLAKALQSGTAGEKLVISYFQAYIDAMAPGKILDAKKGATNQQSLWRGILTAINNEADFDKCFSLMIAFVREHRKGAFADTHAFRFTEQMSIGVEQIKAFQTVVSIFQIAAGLKDKKDIRKQVDLNKAMTAVFTEAARQRVINFFN